MDSAITYIKPHKMFWGMLVGYIYVRINEEYHACEISVDNKGNVKLSLPLTF